MIKPKEAIEKLWKRGFFKPPYKKTKDIKNKALKSYGCTCSNWAVLLRKSKFLRKDKQGWIQKYNAEKEGSIQIIKIEAGKPRTATKTFEEIIKKFSGGMAISDPYLTEDGLDLLEKIKAKNIKFLFHQKQDKLSERDIEDFKKQNSNIELRKFEKPYLHDRYILGKNKILIIGHGLSLRNKETFIILLEDSIARDLRLSLLEIFDRRWKEANPI